MGYDIPADHHGPTPDAVRQAGTYAVPRNATERAQTALARQQEVKRLRKAASERRSGRKDTVNFRGPDDDEEV